MSAAAGGAARGPLALLLQSQTGQWITISLGAIYAFPEQAKMVLGDLESYGALAKKLSGFDTPTLGDKNSSQVATVTATPAPIIIHQTVPSSDGKNQYVTLLVKVAIGGTACWVGYFALTNALPEYVQEFFPVTRKFFAKTSKFLASAVENVRKHLEEQIGIVSKKQDELSDKLDGTNDSIYGLQKELGEARGDLSRLNESMARQESTLFSSHRTQSYTSKGVTLLVRCVASMLPSNDRTVSDLAQYIKDGEEIQKHEIKQAQERRISAVALKSPVSTITPGPSASKKKTQQIAEDKNVLIRESRADSDLDSLEDVRTVLGITGKPGNFIVA